MIDSQRLSSCHFQPGFSNFSLRLLLVTFIAQESFSLVGKMAFLRPFVESIRQEFHDKLAVFIQVIGASIGPFRQDSGNKLAVVRQFIESTGEGLGNKTRQLVGSIRQGLDDKMLVFNHTQLLQAIGRSFAFIITTVLLNLISSTLYEQMNVLGPVSGFIVLARYLPMSFVQYYHWTITVVIVWVVRNRLFIKLKVIGCLPLVAGPVHVCPENTSPSSHPLVAQRQDCLIRGPPHSQTTGQPHPQVTGPTDAQATAPSEPHGTGPLDLELLFLYLEKKYGVPAPAISGNSVIESISVAQEGPEAMALTVHFNGVVAYVEGAYSPTVTLRSGSKVLYRRFDFGSETQTYNLEDLRKLVIESMSRARTLDPECTLQLGSFAMLKYTDSGLKWWKLQKAWIPTIFYVRQSPWNFLYQLSGSRRNWIVRGSNLETATLKASTVNEVEKVKILRRDKVESKEDLLLCEEPLLIQASAPREKVYICASNKVKVQEGVEFDLQSEPVNVDKSSWKFGMGRLTPRRLTMTMVLRLSLVLLGWLLRGLNYGVQVDVLRLPFVTPVWTYASSDSYWEKMLPPSYADILGQAKDAPPITSPKKENYNFLSNRVLFQNDTQDSWLDEETGGICQSIGARGLRVTWGNNARYWDCWQRRKASRFSEVAYLRNVQGVEARGRLLASLFPGKYTVSWRLSFQDSINPLQFSLEVTGNEPVNIHCRLTASSTNVSTYHSAREHQLAWRWEPAYQWMEVDVGEFSVERKDSPVEVQISMFHEDDIIPGLYLDGIMIRPSSLIPGNQNVHNTLQRTTSSEDFGDAPKKSTIVPYRSSYELGSKLHREDMHSREI